MLWPVNLYLPILRLTTVRCQIGEEINGQVILHTGISYVDRLELCYANRDFALSFSDLPYLEKSHKYAYRLSPYQKKWDHN